MSMPDKVLVIEASGGCGEKWDLFKASTAEGGVLFDLESSVPYLGEIESIDTIWMPPEKARALADLLIKKADEAEKSK